MFNALLANDTWSLVYK